MSYVQSQRKGPRLGVFALFGAVKNDEQQRAVACVAGQRHPGTVSGRGAGNHARGLRTISTFATQVRTDRRGRVHRQVAGDGRTKSADCPASDTAPRDAPGGDSPALPAIPSGGTPTLAVFGCRLAGGAASGRSETETQTHYRWWFGSGMKESCAMNAVDLYGLWVVIPIVDLMRR